MEEANRTNNDYEDVSVTGLTPSVFHDVCNNIIKELNKSSSALKLFPKNETKKQHKLRPSMVDRDLARSRPKRSVVSSTPMPCIHQKNFLPSTSDLVSPIRSISAVKPTKPMHSRTKLFTVTNDTPITVSSTSSAHAESSSHAKSLVKGQSVENLAVTLHRSSEDVEASHCDELQDKAQRLENLVSSLRQKNGNRFYTIDKMVQTSNTNSTLQGVRKLARNSNSRVDISLSPTEEREFEVMGSSEGFSTVLDKLEKNFFNRPDDGPIAKHLPEINIGLPWRATSGLLGNVPLEANSLVTPVDSDEESLDETFLPKRHPKTKVFINKKKLTKASGTVLNNRSSVDKRNESILDGRNLDSTLSDEVFYPSERPEKDKEPMKITTKGKQKRRLESLTEEGERGHLRNTNVAEVKDKKKQNKAESPLKKQIQQNAKVSKMKEKEKTIRDEEEMVSIVKNYIEEGHSGQNMDWESSMQEKDNVGEKNKNVASSRKQQKKLDPADRPSPKRIRNNINNSKMSNKKGKQNMTRDDTEMVSFNTDCTDNWRKDLFGESLIEEKEHLGKGNKLVQSSQKRKKKQNRAESLLKKQKKLIMSVSDKKNRQNAILNDSDTDEREMILVKVDVHKNPTRKDNRNQVKTCKQVKNLDNVDLLVSGLEMMPSSEDTSRDVETIFTLNEQEIISDAPEKNDMEHPPGTSKKTSVTKSIKKTSEKSPVRKIQNKKRKEVSLSKRQTNVQGGSTTEGIETIADESTGTRRSGRQRKQTKFAIPGYISCTEHDKYYKVATLVKSLSQVPVRDSIRCSALQKQRTEKNQLSPIKEIGYEVENNTKNSKVTRGRTKKPAKKQTSKEHKKPRCQETKTKSRDERDVTTSERTEENVVSFDENTRNTVQNTETLQRLENGVSGTFCFEDLHDTLSYSTSLQGKVSKNSVISGRVSKRSSTRTIEKKLRDSLKRTVENQLNPKDPYVNCPATNTLIRYSFKKPVYQQMDSLPGVTFAVMEGINTGWLKLSGGVTKPLYRTKNHTMSFTVIEGQAEAGIQNKCDLYKKHDTFVVPQGAEYYVKNHNKTKQLLLLFTRYVDAEKSTLQ
ncbi:uncharacterized protein LOC123011369 [Tribolium madens]|uniref:uncharacterized protein LOC123011369 n=1 Tax=Tribolium madens TaxID=41895 RepID=UPI001CF75211|nr:uncharacterized protein LOC123011369 [Tribolium madens]